MMELRAEEEMRQTMLWKNREFYFPLILSTGWGSQ